MIRLVFSIQNFTRLLTSFLWLQNSIDQAVSYNEYLIVFETTAAKYDAVRRNTTHIVNLQMHVLQFLNA